MKNIDKATLGEALAMNTLDDIRKPKAMQRKSSVWSKAAAASQAISSPTVLLSPKKRALLWQKTVR